MFHLLQAIQQLQSKSLQQHTPTPQMTHNPPMDIFLVGAAMDIFQSLIKSLDTEGRYLFLNAVANQLRYPNNHTHYFSFVLLYLFAEATQVRNYQSVLDGTHLWLIFPASNCIIIIQSRHILSLSHYLYLLLLTLHMSFTNSFAFQRINHNFLLNFFVDK